MEGKTEPRRARRIFTAEQKFEILKDIERCQTIKEGLAKHQIADSLYRKWRRQLEVGVRASLRNGRPLKPADLRRLEAENRKLKEVVLNQALLISELKKEMNKKGVRSSNEANPNHASPSSLTFRAGRTFRPPVGKCITAPTKALDNATENSQIRSPIPIPVVDRFLPIAPRS